GRPAEGGEGSVELPALRLRGCGRASRGPGRGSRAWHSVAQLYQAVLETFRGEQLQRHMAGPPRDQGNAVSDEHRDHADDELVDRARVEERRDQLAAPHQPDVLARPLAEAADELADVSAHELDSRWDVRRRFSAREDEGRALRVELPP